MEDAFLKTVYKTIDGHLCLQPIYWHYKTLYMSGVLPTGDAIYNVDAPIATEGHWMGYYIEVQFPGDTPQPFMTVFKNDLIVSTPGYTWPDTLPFEDCWKDSCIGRTV